jgi:hypothetical protein
MSVAFVALFLLSQPTFAHELKAALTTVLFNPRTSNIEVTHRFYLHDAEHAVKAIFGNDADIIGSEKTQQQFATYVRERFLMADQTGKNLPLSEVGFEVERRFFWVYQETKEPTTLQNLTISHNALRDLWPEQINSINIEGKGDVKSLTFNESVELLSVELIAEAEHH